MNKGFKNKQESYIVFLKELKEKRPNLIYKKDIFSYNPKKVEVECKFCGKVFITNRWSLVQTEKYLCCTLKITEKTRFYTSIDNDIFLEKLKKINNTIIPLEEYKGYTEKIIAQCKTCSHKWKVMPSTLLSGSGCPICNGGGKFDLFQYKQLVEKNSPWFELLDTEYKPYEKSKVKCKKCGKIRDTNKQKLRLGLVNCQFCKSGRKSNPERKIERFLIKNNIDYIYQKRYDDLIGKNKQPLRFDFYIPKYNMCIEYDGEGHFKKDFRFNKGVLNHTNDKKKEKYCNVNNITLLRIPFWEQKNMNEYLRLVLEELEEHTSTITYNYRSKRYSHLDTHNEENIDAVSIEDILPYIERGFTFDNIGKELECSRTYITNRLKKYYGEDYKEFSYKYRYRSKEIKNLGV